MTRIKVISPSQASGELAEIYREVQVYMPWIGNLVQVCSAWPEWVRMSGLNMLTTMEAGTLSRQRKEMLAVVTSRSGACGY